MRPSGWRVARAWHTGEKFREHLPLLDQAIGHVRVERVVDPVLHLDKVACRGSDIEAAGRDRLVDRRLVNRELLTWA